MVYVRRRKKATNQVVGTYMSSLLTESVDFGGKDKELEESVQKELEESTQSDSKELEENVQEDGAST